MNDTLSPSQGRTRGFLTIYRFGEHAARTVDYFDTEHYQITKAFLEHPARMLHERFRDDGAER